MKKSVLKKSIALVATSAILASCGGGGSSSSSSTWGIYSNPNVTAQGFVNSLNDVDGVTFPFDSYIVKDIDETVRNNEDWFVIYDAEYDEYVAVSLQYIRSITYYDYYSSNFNLAEEFRDIQDDDEFFNGLIGDGFGDDYEIVDYDYTDIFGEDYYEGFDSGLLYEDGAEVTDVSMLQGEAENKAFAQKAAAVSATYNVSIETSLSLVTLGKKVETMMANGGGELTTADQEALMGDLQKLTGVTLEDVNNAAGDKVAQEQMLQGIADKIGTSSQNLTDALLPALGINVQ